jgi:hypothetical protein
MLYGTLLQSGLQVVEVRGFEQIDQTSGLIGIEDDRCDRYEQVPFDAPGGGSG